MIATLLPAVFLVSAFAYAQPSDGARAKPLKELAIDFGVVHQQIASHYFTGISNNLKAYITRRWVMGSYLSVTQKKIDNSFHYTVGKPVVAYAGAGWLNGFDVVQTPHWRINVNVVKAWLTQGLAMMMIR